MGDFSITATNCRLCLRNEKFQIPIFGEIGNEMQIASKIKTCLPIQVMQEDCYPKHICYKCLASLDQSYALWKLSSESEALLRNITSKLSKKFPGLNNMNTRPLTAKNINGNTQSKNSYYEDSDSEDGLPFKALRLASDSDDDEYDDRTLDKVFSWPEDGNEEVMMIDSSPNFLESLDAEESSQHRNCNAQNSTESTMTNTTGTNEVVKLQCQVNTMHKTTDIGKNTVTGCKTTNPFNVPHYGTDTNKNGPSYKMMTVHGLQQLHDNSGFTSAINPQNRLTIDSKNSHKANESNHQPPYSTGIENSTNFNRMAFTPSSFQISNDSTNSTSFQKPLDPHQRFPPRRINSVSNASEPQSSPSPSNFTFHNKRDITNMQHFENPSDIKMQEVISQSSLQISSKSSTTGLTNISDRQISLAHGNRSDNISKVTKIQASPNLQKENTATILNSPVTSELLDMSRPTRLSSVSLFQMSPDSWRKFLKKE